jgi:hypothetical protein
VKPPDEKVPARSANHEPANPNSTSSCLPACPPSSRPGTRRLLNEVIGGPELCAWQPIQGLTWVQTRSPGFALKLSRRRDSRLVVRGVAGGYLRTFEFGRPIAWAQRLITRYTLGETVTNAPKITPVLATDGVSIAGL